MGNQQGSEDGKKSPEGGKKKDHRKKDSPKCSKKSSKQSSPGATSSRTGSSKSKSGESSDKLTVKGKTKHVGKERQQQSVASVAAAVSHDQPSVPDVYTDAVDHANDLMASLDLDTGKQSTESSSDDNISFESVSCATPLLTASPNLQRLNQATGVAAINTPVDSVEELGKSIERTIIERFSDTPGANVDSPDHVASKPIPNDTRVNVPKQHGAEPDNDGHQRKSSPSQTPQLTVNDPSMSEMENTHTREDVKPGSKCSKDQCTHEYAIGLITTNEKSREPSSVKVAVPSQFDSGMLSTDTEAAAGRGIELESKISQRNSSTEDEGGSHTDKPIALDEPRNDLPRRVAHSDLSELNIQETRQSVSSDKTTVEQTKPKAEEPRQQIVERTEQQIVSESKKYTVQKVAEKVKPNAEPTFQQTQQTIAEDGPQHEQDIEQHKQSKAESVFTITTPKRQDQQTLENSMSNISPQQVQNNWLTEFGCFSHPPLITEQATVETMLDTEQKVQEHTKPENAMFSLQNINQSNVLPVEENTSVTPVQHEEHSLSKDSESLLGTRPIFQAQAPSEYEDQPVQQTPLVTCESQSEQTVEFPEIKAPPYKKLIVAHSVSIPHAIPKSGLLKTDDDSQTDSEQTSHTHSSLDVNKVSSCAELPSPMTRHLHSATSSYGSPIALSHLTDLFISENNDEPRALKNDPTAVSENNTEGSSFTCNRKSSAVECKTEEPYSNRSSGVAISAEPDLLRDDNEPIGIHKESKSAQPSTPMSRLDSLDSILMLIKQTMESDALDEIKENIGMVNVENSDCTASSAAQNISELLPEKISVESVTADDMKSGPITIEEETEKTLTPEDMAEFERLKRQAVQNGSGNNDGDEEDIGDENDDTLTQEDLAEFDRLKRKILHVSEAGQTEYTINAGEYLSFPLHIVDKFDLSSGETTEDSVIERPALKMEPVLASTMEEDYPPHDGQLVEVNGGLEQKPNGSPNQFDQTDNSKPLFTLVPESPHLRRRSFTEDEIKQQIRKFMIPEIKEALPQGDTLKQMLEDLHNITPTSEQTPSVEDREDMTTPDHATGSGLRSRTSITSSELDMSEQRDDVSTDSMYADDEDDSASEVLFCKTYTEPELGSEVLVSCTVVNSALKWEEGGSSDEFWAESSAAEDAYRQVEISADAANRHFNHARSQMQDIQHHLQSLRYQMQEMERQVAKSSLPSTDEFCFDDPERRAITD